MGRRKAREAEGKGKREGKRNRKGPLNICICEFLENPGNFLALS